MAAERSDSGERPASRGLGVQAQQHRTYAGLAAASGRGAGVEGISRRTTSAGSGGSSGGGGGYSSRPEPGGPPTSAFFKPQVLGQRRQRTAAAVAGSVTPPNGRTIARMGTPDSVASPFLEDEHEDDILFQMSGLKPLRTSSRTAAAAAAAAASGYGRSHQKPAAEVHRTRSAPAAEAGPSGAAEPAAAPPPPAPAVGAHMSPLNRAFSFAGELSPRAGAPPLPTASGSAARQRTRSRKSGEGSARAGAAPSPGLDADFAAAMDPCSTRSSPASGDPASAAAAAGADAAAGAGAAPGWSEELLSWMLNEKAGLLMEAQRAQRRQAELQGELERLRARGSGVEREAQHLQAERRLMLDRVQQLSAAEAEASARVERLSMENDALTSELERSQEVCREMLAARRAARDALSEMSAQNARLLAAYVDKKQEAAQLRDALQRQQRESEACVRSLEAQLQAARVTPGALLGSPPASPPLHAGRLYAGGPAEGTATPGQLPPLHPKASDYGSGASAATPAACSPQLNKENANAAGNGSARSTGRGRGPDKVEWDEERSELLTLLERLQGQLMAHAEQQHGQQGAAGGATDGSPQPRQHGTAAGGGNSGMPSPVCQTPAARAAEDVEQQLPGQSSMAAAAILEDPVESGSAEDGLAEGSFDSVNGPADADSPVLAAHHSTESPARQQQPARSAARSDAASPLAGHPQAPVAPSPTPMPAQAVQQQQQHGQRLHQKPSSGRTLDPILGSVPPCSSPLPAPAAVDAAQAAAEEQRLQQAERRTAELEAEVKRLQQANAAAEQRTQREERRRVAEGAKAAGNAAFQAERFEEAVQHYSRGLESLGQDLGGSSSSSNDGGAAALAAVLHCNRAAAHQASGRYLHALADCFRAEALDPAYTRVYHRRADAYWAMGAWGAAAQDLGRLLELGAGQDVAARLVEAQRRAASGQPPNHYSVLAVKAAAAPGEVKSAFRQLALIFHPDKAAKRQGQGQGLGLATDAAHAIFKLLSEAAAVLGDAEQRRHHDIATLRFKYRRYAAGF